MDNFISLEIIWQDDDLIEIQASSSSGKFFGVTEVYTNYEDLDALANALVGFPHSVDERVEFNAGAKDGYSFVSISFYCFSNSGHTAALVDLEANIAQNQRKNEKHKVTMEVQFEAQAIDSFQKQISSLIRNKAGKALLSGIKPCTQNILKGGICA
ncbi:hypothetical protein Geob_0995 [Geotalea daltonii FRC-32]|uniref:Uncharacterized protein n=1 Tax=Geotalea daltonii (strain DSM 22248 / JCM 15807 / FRC-32) TaxID=316067 RepID=B9M2H8_GEODF|nr:hypothetical protein [Geotalea daltonii]ACM19357.1 hypothetical protein Geob_0995 [Geotalea daltonii FRC-32]